MTNPYSMPQAQLTEPVSKETYMPKFFAVNGRIGRVRYLAYSMGAGLLMLPLMLLLLGGSGFAAMMGSAETGASVGIVGSLIIYPLSFAVSIILARRRLHDMNKTGWLSVLVLIPLVNLFAVLWLLFGSGDAESNDFGPAPAPNTTGVIILAWSLPVLVVAGGILAAIAIPAYADYAAKANAVQLENGQ
ncbi:DUF805 domain-containing protein [Pseudoduganella sp. DS3]|uniref:DUF805 domain-containing protein n=1 Tax=Pseudoduganella guangdongensis TaxID=2692179 RepID=A0A6N9HHU1_9BURK|nr:DUF805 domain-containing protein [Pseudoduganella guangdongensis]MYN02643.1 DUF805 domain-containing protein [Pseudoduganella guangdongensis]